MQTNYNDTNKLYKARSIKEIAKETKKQTFQLFLYYSKKNQVTIDFKNI